MTQICFHSIDIPYDSTCSPICGLQPGVKLDLGVFVATKYYVLSFDGLNM